MPDLREEIRVAVEALIAEAEGCRMVGASPIGPLHGCGWNEAQALIVKRLREKAAAILEAPSASEWTVFRPDSEMGRILDEIESASPSPEGPGGSCKTSG